MGKTTAVQFDDEKNEVSVFDHAGDGGEDFGMEDVKLSYLQLTQGSSEAAKTRLAQAGDFLDVATKINLGQNFTVVIVKKLAKRWMTYRPQETKEETALPSPKKLSDGLEWKENEKMKSSADGVYWSTGEPVDAADAWKYEVYDFIVFLKSDKVDQMPRILSFKKTSKASGKELISLLARFTKVQKEPIYGRSYEVFSQLEVPKGNSTNSYYVQKVRILDGFNDKATMDYAAELRQNIQKAEGKITDVLEDVTKHAVVEDKDLMD